MIRHGFVSNSSSSSFILSYNKNNIICGAENIVEFIKANPTYDMVLDGGNTDKRAVFILENSHKSLIRRYSEEFINHPGSELYRLFYGNQAYRVSYLHNDDLILKRFSESDISRFLDPGKHEYNISSEEYNEVLNKYLNELREKTVDREAENVWVDWNVTLMGDSLDDEDFFKMFLSTESEFDRDWIIGDCDNSPYMEPYALVFGKRISNKEAIVEYLKYEKPETNVGLCWMNEGYERVAGRFVDMEMYALTSKEIEYLISHEDEFLNSTASLSLFVDYRFYRNNIVINNADVGKNILMRTGNFKEVVDCFEDFSEIFF